jgi:hypothetical protein
MAKRIVYDVPIGVGERLLASINAWADYLNQPRSEYCRNILERHQKRIGIFPPPPPANPFEQSDNSPMINSVTAAE